jgi:OFA family oxalate/formate antiporter-like MFS transporter
MYRYLTLAWSFIIQICLGAVYAWSTYVVPLKNNYGLSSLQTQVIFGLMIAVFASMMIVTGRLLRKRSIRIVTAAGSIMYALGYLAASFSNGSFLLLLSSMGVVVGTGLGLAYISSIIASQKCFPQQKGLVTGLVVAGFGAGAVSISLIVKPFLNKGIEILTIFRWMGIVYFVIIMCGAFFLKTPEEKSNSQNKKVQLKELIRQRIFRTMFICMFTGTFAGLMIIGNLSPIGLSMGTSQSSAVLAISTFALGNASGRIIWGKLYDTFGKIMIPASLATMGLSLLGLLFFGYSDFLFPFFTSLTGFSFGANLVLYAAHTAGIYGINLVGSVYPYVSMAYGVSAIIGPTLGGLFYDLTGGFAIPLIIAFILSFMGSIVFIAHSKKRSDMRSA